MDIDNLICACYSFQKHWDVSGCFKFRAHCFQKCATEFLIKARYFFVCATSLQFRPLSRRIAYWPSIRVILESPQSAKWVVLSNRIGYVPLAWVEGAGLNAGPAKRLAFPDLGSFPQALKLDWTSFNLLLTLGQDHSITSIIRSLPSDTSHGYRFQLLRPG